MYKVSQEQEILRDTISEFAKDQIEPLAARIDAEGIVPRDILGKLPGMGLFGVTVPVEYGGAGSDLLSSIIASEEISRASGSLGSQISFHNCVVCESFVSSSNALLKETILPKLASGSLGAFVFNSKSPIRCTIKEGKIVIDGTSQSVTNASSAGVLLVCGKLAGDKEEILVGFTREGLGPQAENIRTTPIKQMGMRAAGFAKITFDNLELPLESLVFEIPKSGREISKLYSNARLAVASQAVGVTRACIDSSVRYANERVQFNTKIGRFFAIQDFIATDEISLETCKGFTYSTASNRSSKNFERDSAIAKIASSNCAVAAARHAIRIHGGYGFMRDYPVERYMRDCRITQIELETNEKLKELIAGSLLGYI